MIFMEGLSVCIHCSLIQSLFFSNCWAFVDFANLIKSNGFGVDVRSVYADIDSLDTCLLN